MGKRVADQHAVMDRGWEEADKLAEAIRVVLEEAEIGWDVDCGGLLVALRRYEEARQS